MHCVVTGASGFIGYHLVRMILDRGHSLCVVDKRESGVLKGLQIEHADRMRIIWGNVEDYVVVNAAVEGADVVFHLAAQPDIRQSWERPDCSIHDDLITAVNLLDACVDSRSRPRVVLASSAAVYGALAPSVVKEKDSILAQLLSPYAINKQACELYADMYRRMKDLSTVCLRYFNVYGTRQQNISAVITSFVLKALRGEPLTVRGDGLQTRDYIHVSDVAEATLMMGVELSLCGSYNVGSGVPHTLLEVILYLEQILGHELEVRYEPAPSYDIRHSCADIRWMQEAGWSPKIGLRQGLAEMVEFYRTIDL